jgi:hypothetical protein
MSLEYTLLIQSSLFPGKVVLYNHASNVGCEFRLLYDTSNVLIYNAVLMNVLLKQK